MSATLCFTKRKTSKFTRNTTVLPAPSIEERMITDLVAAGAQQQQQHHQELGREVQVHPGAHPVLCLKLHPHQLPNLPPLQKTLPRETNLCFSLSALHVASSSLLLITSKPTRLIIAPSVREHQGRRASPKACGDVLGAAAQCQRPCRQPTSVSHPPLPHLMAGSAHVALLFLPLQLLRRSTWKPMLASRASAVQSVATVATH